MVKNVAATRQEFTTQFVDLLHNDPDAEADGEGGEDQPAVQDILDGEGLALAGRTDGQINQLWKSILRRAGLSKRLVLSMSVPPDAPAQHGTWVESSRNFW